MIGRTKVKLICYWSGSFLSLIVRFDILAFIITLVTKDGSTKIIFVLSIHIELNIFFI